MGSKKLTTSVSKWKYIEALLFTIAVFIIGFGVGSLFEQAKLEHVKLSIEEARTDLLSNEVAYLLLKESKCSNALLKDISSQLYSVGESLEELEKKKGYDDKEVVDLKKRYFLMEIKHWLFVREYKNKCNKTYHVVLYFYSNEKCDMCADQGYVLTYVKKKYPNHLIIYSFDVDYDLAPLKTIITTYNVTQVPSLVIDDKLYSGYVNAQKLQHIIENA